MNYRNYLHVPVMFPGAFSPVSHQWDQLTGFADRFREFILDSEYVTTTGTARKQWPELRYDRSNAWAVTMAAVANASP